MLNNTAPRYWEKPPLGRLVSELVVAMMLPSDWVAPSGLLAMS